MHDPYQVGGPEQHLPYDRPGHPIHHSPPTVSQVSVDPSDLGAWPGPWDPEAELAYLLQAHDTQRPGPPAGETHDGSLIADGIPPARAVESTLDMPAVRASPPGTGHRRHRTHPRAPLLLRTVSFLIAALAATIVAMVSVLGGVVAYDPLRSAATTTAPTADHRLWPLLVYGPWTVASLSILRAALHQRRATHSWYVALFFSLVAVGLCVAQAPPTPTAWCTAALPPVAALTCFQQLVRQITLTRPPRQSTPRHRNHSSTPERSPSADTQAVPAPAPDGTAAKSPSRHDAKPRFPRQHSSLGD
jgi:hypothetical protein